MVFVRLAVVDPLPDSEGGELSAVFTVEIADSGVVVVPFGHNGLCDNHFQHSVMLLSAGPSRVLNSGGLLIPSLHRITVTVMNSILTFRNNHAIITLIVTVFSLEDKVSVLQSVKWRHCAVWHFFCFLPAERGSRLDSCAV